MVMGLRKIGAHSDPSFIAWPLLADCRLIRLDNLAGQFQQELCVALPRKHPVRVGQQTSRGRIVERDGKLFVGAAAEADCYDL